MNDEELGDDEKNQMALDEYMNYALGHSVDARISFDDVEITLPYIAFYADRNGGEGYFSAYIEYSGMPPFDPNFVDFTLRIDGAEYPMRMSDGTEEYRRRYEPATTIKELIKDDWGYSTYYNEGVLTTYFAFPVSDWNGDEPAEMALRATIDQRELVIPFQYDPVKAREEAEKQARQDVQFTEQIQSEEKAWLEAREGASVPVGIKKTRGRYTLSLSEISYVEDTVNFTFVSGGLNEEELGDGFSLFDPIQIDIDGVRIPFAGATSRRETEGDEEIQKREFEVGDCVLTIEEIYYEMDDFVVAMRYDTGDGRGAWCSNR